MLLISCCKQVTFNWSSFSSVSCCQTLYSVRAEILPPPGEQHCRSGLVCGLEVCITRLTEPSEGEIAEDSKTDTDGLKNTKLMYEGMLAAITLHYVCLINVIIKLLLLYVSGICFHSLDSFKL